MAKHNATDGDYLVRQREAGSPEYILVLIFKGRPTHHLMKQEGDAWSINKKVFVPNQPDLLQVMEALKKPVAGWPVLLKNAIVQGDNQSSEAPAAASTSSSDEDAAKKKAEQEAKEKEERERREREERERREREERERREREERERQEEAEERRRKAADEASAAADDDRRRREEAEREQQRREEQQRAEAAERERREKQAAAAAAAASASSASAATAAAASGAASDAKKELDSAAKEVSRLEVALAEAERKLTEASRPKAPAGGSAAANINPSDPPYLWNDFITREDSEAKIAGANDGTFLIRKRKEKEGQYIMALVYKGKPTHHLMQEVDGNWTVNNKAYGNNTTIGALIDTLSKPTQGWPVLLNNPVNDPSKAGGDAEPTVDQAAKSAAEAEVSRIESQLKSAKSRVSTAQSQYETALRAEKDAVAAASTAAATVDSTPTVTSVPEESTDIQAAKTDNDSPAASRKSPSGRDSSPTSSIKINGAATAHSTTDGDDEDKVQTSKSSSSKQRGKPPRTGTQDDDDSRTEGPKTVGRGKSGESSTAVQLPPAPPQRRGPPQTYDMVGRAGFADFLNGQYEEQDGVFFDNHPVFKRTYVTDAGYGQTTSKDLYLFYHEENGAWAVSHQMGARGIVAYIPSNADRPSEIRGVWKVSNRDGQFIPDENVRCVLSTPGMSTFRRSLQSGQELNFFQYRLSDSQIADLCEELRSSQCRVKRLKLYANHLLGGQLRKIIGVLNSNASITHLQIRENNVDDKLAEEIGSMLQNNTTLKIVSLRGNKIGDQGAKWLAEALRRNKTLLGLSLRDNEIGDLGVEMLSDALKVNETLRGLAIYDNSFKLNVARRHQRRVFKYNSKIDFEIQNPLSVGR